MCIRRCIYNVLHFSIPLFLFCFCFRSISFKLYLPRFYFCIRADTSALIGWLYLYLPWLIHLDLFLLGFLCISLCTFCIFSFWVCFQLDAHFCYFSIFPLLFFFSTAVGYMNISVFKILNQILPIKSIQKFSSIYIKIANLLYLSPKHFLYLAYYFLDFEIYTFLNPQTVPFN